MIISPSREEDKEIAVLVLDILENTVRSYERTGDERLLPHIESLNNWYDSLTEKIKHGDYTEEDARWMRVERRMQELRKALCTYGD